MNPFNIGIDLPRGVLGVTKEATKMTKQFINGEIKHTGAKKGVEIASEVIKVSGGKGGVTFAATGTLKGGVGIFPDGMLKSGTITCTIDEFTNKGAQVVTTETLKGGIGTLADGMVKSGTITIGELTNKGAQLAANEGIKKGIEVTFTKEGVKLLTTEVLKRGIEVAGVEVTKEGAKFVGIEAAFQGTMHAVTGIANLGAGATTSEIIKEGVNQGAKTVITEAVQQTTNSVANTITTTAVSGTGVGFLSTSLGKAALGGSIALVTTLGSMFFAKDKLRAFVTGAPSIAISMIPGIGIPAAIGWSLLTNVAADKIYTLLQDRPQELPPKQSQNLSPQISDQYLKPESFLPITKIQVIEDLMLQLAEKLKEINKEMSRIIPIATADGGGGDPDPWKFVRVSFEVKHSRELLNQISKAKLKKTPTTNYFEELLEMKGMIQTFEQSSEIATITLKDALANIKRRLNTSLEKLKKDIIDSKEEKEDREKMKEQERLLRHILATLRFIETLSDELRARLEGQLKIDLEKYKEVLEAELELIFGLSN